MCTVDVARIHNRNTTKRMTANTISLAQVSFTLAQAITQHGLLAILNLTTDGIQADGQYRSNEHKTGKQGNHDDEVTHLVGDEKPARS